MLVPGLGDLLNIKRNVGQGCGNFAQQHLTCTMIYILHCALIKKKTTIFLIYQEIQKGAVAKSYMTLTASSHMTKYLRISSYIRKLFLMTLQTLHPEFPYTEYEENFICFFVSVPYIQL